MKTVYKYVLDPGATPCENGTRTKRLLRVVHVAPDYSDDWKLDREFGMPPALGQRERQIRAERVTVWCEVDTEAEQATGFTIVGTGHPVPKGMVHCGTAVMPSGLVWHVYVPQNNFAVELA